MRSVLLLVLVVAACGGLGDFTMSADSTPPGGGRIDDCNAAPLARPTFDVRGVEVPESGHLRLIGVLDEIAQTRGQIEISLNDETSGQVMVRLEFARPVQIDLRAGSKVEIDYWQRQGFEGTARGIRLRDDHGLALLADDGNYGNALLPEDLAAFTVAQIDAGCRKRENRPGSLNNFRLAVTADDSSVELMHGETGNLMIASREYSVLALQSVARVGAVSWTDAPYEHTAFSIARVPAE